MKKVKLLVLLFLCLVAAGTFAQYSALSIAPGFSIAKQGFPFTGDYMKKSLFSFDGGIGVEFGITKKFSLQAEIGFSTSGIVIKDTTGASTKLQNRYLIVPLLVKFYLKPGFSIFGGPQYGYLLNGRFKGNDTTIDATGYYKSSDFLVAAGIEYRLPLGLFASARYQYGLANILKSDEYNVKNRYFSFRIGYSLPLSRLRKK
jgi:hypothetical protein